MELVLKSGTVKGSTTIFPAVSDAMECSFSVPTAVLKQYNYVDSDGDPSPNTKNRNDVTHVAEMALRKGLPLINRVYYLTVEHFENIWAPFKAQ